MCIRDSIRTSVGRIIFNEPIPQDLGYVDRSDPERAFDHEIGFQVGKKQLGDIIDRCIQKYGFTISAEVLDNIKALGFKYSCLLYTSLFEQPVEIQQQQGQPRLQKQQNEC